MTRELLHFVVQKCHLEINLIIISRVGIRLQSIKMTQEFFFRLRNYLSLWWEMFRIFDNNNQLRKIILVCLRQWELKPSIMTHIRGGNYDCHSNTIWVKHVFQQHLSFYETVLCHGRLFPSWKSCLNVQMLVALRPHFSTLMRIDENNENWGLTGPDGA